MDLDFRSLECKLTKLSDGEDVETLWQTFHTNYSKSVRNNVPERQLKRKPSLPWINNDIRKLMTRRDRLFSKW